MGRNKQPQVPGLSAEERNLLQQQGVTLQQLNNILSGENINAQQNQQLLRGISGLYNPDGSINQEQLAGLRERTLAQQQLQEQLGTTGLNYLQSLFGSNEFQNQSNQAGMEEVNQYLRALRGESGPLSEGLRQQEADQFNRLRESAASRGIRITGDDLFTATSDSTAGNQLLSQLRQNSQFNRETQRENALQRLQGANMQRLGFGLQREGQLANIAQGAQYAPGSAQLGYMNAAQQAGPGSLLGSYNQLAQGYGNAAEPYRQQRYLQYQGALQNSANNSAFRGGLGSLVGGGLGAAFTGGSPLGFGIGSGIGGAIGQSGMRRGQLGALGLGGLGAYGLYNSFSGMRSGTGYGV